MMYQRATETLVEEFSLPRVQKALESFLTRQRFFPPQAKYGRFWNP
jgi:hypothetical protein